MSGFETEDPPLPYESLLPVVRALELGGNVAIDGGFLNSPAGWYCRMAQPIDFKKLRTQVVVPPYVELIEASDTILDRSTWSAVLGPGADGY